jgi:putative heme iron utilization protein
MDLSEEVLAMTRDHAALKQTRLLTDSLIEIVEADRFDEVIGEIGSDIL